MGPDSPFVVLVSRAKLLSSQATLIHLLREITMRHRQIRIADKSEAFPLLKAAVYGEVALETIRRK